MSSMNMRLPRAVDRRNIKSRIERVRKSLNAITIAEALQIGIEESDADAPHKRVMQDTAGYAETFLQDFLRLKRMDQLEELHVVKYIRHLEGQGLAARTIKHYCIPIRHAHNATKYDTGCKIDWKTLPFPKVQRTAPNFLTASEGMRILRSLSGVRGYERAYAGLASCFLAGLRISEFNRLTPDRLIGDELEISGITKNYPSRRVIPIPPHLVEILINWFSLRLPPYRDPRETGRCISQALRDSNAKAYAGPNGEIRIEPREAGRKSWVQVAAAAMVPKAAAQAYMGHAISSDTIDRAYEFNSPPRPEHTPQQKAQRMEWLRKVVLEPVTNSLNGA